MAGRIPAILLLALVSLADPVGPSLLFAQPEPPSPNERDFSSPHTPTVRKWLPVPPVVRDVIIQETLSRLAHSSGGVTTALHISPGALWTTNGRAIRSVRSGAGFGVWDVDIHLERQTSDGEAKSGEMYTRLPFPIDMSLRPWKVSGSLLVPRALIGAGPEEYLTPMRARWVLRDARGHRCFGPNTGCSLVADRWIAIEPLLPTRDTPVPKGLIEEAFDLTQVVEVGLNIEAGNLPMGPQITHPPRVDYSGAIHVRGLEVEPVPTTSAAEAPPRPLYPAPADEAAAAVRLWPILRERLHLREGEMGVMVNLAWPFRSHRYHVYGTSLGLAPWGDHWGFSTDETASALTDDLRYLKQHGIRVVRIFLFGDLRTGLTYDGQGRPVAFSRFVYEDMAALIKICHREEMMIIPSLLDFLVADHVTREGPDLKWDVGEHPDLITRPDARDALARLLVQFVHDFNGPDIPMWELMNEPDNAVAVATPEHFNDLRQFLQALSNGLHREGVITTLGARHLGDYQRFWRGVVDVPQVHHWRLLESIPNPYPIDTPAHALGPLPSMIGEIEPPAPEEVGPLLDRLQRAGYLMVGFWSLRGHDGYAYQPIADAVRTWLMAQRGEVATTADR